GAVGYGNDDTGAFARGALDAQRRSDRRRPLVHVDEALMTGGGGLRRIESDAVVGDHERGATAFPATPDGEAPRAGMAGRVAQRLPGEMQKFCAMFPGDGETRVGIDINIDVD